MTFSLNDHLNKIKNKLNQLIEDNHIDETIEDFKDKWGRLKKNIDNIENEDVKYFLKNIIKGEIALPNDYIEKKILAYIQNKKKITSLKCKFGNNRIFFDVQSGGMLPLQSSFELEIAHILITRQIQTISFKITKPIQADLESVSKDIIASLSALIGISIQKAEDLNPLLPPALQPLTQKGGLVTYDLKDVKQVQSIVEAKLFDSYLLDKFHIVQANIDQEYTHLKIQINDESKGNAQRLS